MFAGLALLAPVPAAAQYMQAGLGRLFTTPDERVNADRNRGNVAPDPVPMPVATPEPPAPPAEPPPPAPPARFTGVVRRSDGRATLWIDNAPRETTLGTLAPGSAVSIDTPAGRVLVKPGQTYDPANGTIQEPR